MNTTIPNFDVALLLNGLQASIRCREQFQSMELKVLREVEMRELSILVAARYLLNSAERQSSLDSRILTGAVSALERALKCVLIDVHRQELERLLGELKAVERKLKHAADEEAMAV